MKKGPNPPACSEERALDNLAQTAQHSAEVGAGYAPCNHGQPKMSVCCSLRRRRNQTLEYAMKLKVYLEPSEEGGYTVTVPALPLEPC